MSAQVASVTPIRPKQRQAAAGEVWLSPVQVCGRVPGMTVGRLQELRKDGRGPAYFKPTLKTVIYAQSDVDEWVRRKRISTREQS